MPLAAPAAFLAFALSPLLPSPAPVTPTVTPEPIAGPGCLLQLSPVARTKLAYLNRARVTFTDPTGGLMGTAQPMRWEVQQPPQRPLVSVTFYVDGEPVLSVTKPDANGTLALETPANYFTAGPHQVGARLFGLNDVGQDIAYDITVSACPITTASATVSRRPRQVGRFTWAGTPDLLALEPDITTVTIAISSGAQIVAPARPGTALGVLHVTGPGRPALDIKLKQPRHGTVVGSSGTARVVVQPSTRTISVTGLPPGSTAGSLDFTGGAVRGVGRCWSAAFRITLRGTTGSVSVPVTDRRRCR